MRRSDGPLAPWTRAECVAVIRAWGTPAPGWRPPLTDAQAGAVQRRYAAITDSINAVARDFAISPTEVVQIGTGRDWPMARAA